MKIRITNIVQAILLLCFILFSEKVSAQEATYKKPEPTAPVERKLEPLPVTLISFNAKQIKANEISINWVSYEEIDNKYFILEKSFDGKSFEVVDTVYAATDMSVFFHNYHVMHTLSTEEMVKIDGSIYFKLSQVDMDGKKQDLKLISTECNFDPIIAKLPGKILVQLKEGMGQCSIDLYSSVGQKVFSLEVEDDSNFVEISTAELNDNLYILSIAKDGIIISTLKISAQ